MKSGLEMNVVEPLSDDVVAHGGCEASPCVGFTTDALPEVQSQQAENSHTGVSTNNVPHDSEKVVSEVLRSGGENAKEKCQNELNHIKIKPRKTKQWYALRATYGREKRAYNYLVEKHVEAYYPTIKTVKEFGGKKLVVEESRLPNIFFARGTEDEIKSFVYDNVNLPYLRFYYCHSHEGRQIIRKPLVIPERQIDSLKIICASEADDIILVPSNVDKFKTGETVRVIDGAFKGVVGKVARYHGQQRVAIIIDGLLTIASAYVPSAFLEKII